MQVHYYSKFPYWGTYYAMLVIPKPVRDWGYQMIKRHQDKFVPPSDIKPKPY